MQSREPRILACPDCELVQRVEVGHDEGCRIACARCGKVLERGTSGLLWFSMLCWIATLVLLAGMLAVPLLGAAFYGLQHRLTAWEGAVELAHGGWPFLAVATVVFAFALPFLRATVVALVLLSLRRRRRPAWLGHLYRHAQQMRSWTVPDVFLLGVAITLVRAGAQLTIVYDAGAWLLIAAVLLFLVADATLEDGVVWNAIAPQPPLDDLRAAVVCPRCALVCAKDRPPRCPRCQSRLRPHRHRSTQVAAALVVTSYLLLIPAYTLTVGTRITPLANDAYTIPTGAREMAMSGYWSLAIIIVVASIGVPIGKLLGLSWLLISVAHGSSRWLRFKTRLYRFVQRIGRWSFTDMFVAGATVALLAYPGLVVAHVGPAMVPFVVVVILTMIASHAFDPRLLWGTTEAQASGEAGRIAR